MCKSSICYKRVFIYVIVAIEMSGIPSQMLTWKQTKIFSSLKLLECRNGLISQNLHTGGH